MTTATPKPATPTLAARDAALRRIELTTILHDDREVIICHRDDEYRLRLTSNDKLLLTK